MTLGPGETIFREGDIDDKLFFVYKGEVELYLSKKEDRSEILLGKLTVFF